MREFNIGGVVPFGGYHRGILDIQGNATLIITEYMIEQHPYNNCAGGVTWADCSLRKYLNGEFCNNGTFRYSSNTIHPSTGDNSGGVRPALWLSLKL